MILQQLQKDADHLVDLPPTMYDRKPVRWIVELDASGKLLGFQQTSGADARRDKGKLRLVPFKTRTMAVRPLLLADKPTYTWGMPRDHKRAAEEHAAYLELLDRCAAETSNHDVAQVAAFLRAWDLETQPLPEMLPDELTTFSVEGRYPIDDPAVRRFWAREAGGEDGAGTPGQCLVCGVRTRVVERLPVNVKGIPNGQSSGVALVSANASAFESYGRSAALTSPICFPCGERFGKAANALLQDDKKHLRVGPVAYLFWTPETEWDLVELFRDPQPEEVKRLLQSARRGTLSAPEDDSPFYATAVSAAMSRAVFRSWLHTTVGTARDNMRRWFRLLRMVDAFGGEGRPLSVFRLSVGLYREARDIPARVPDLLVHHALYGGPLPDWLLLQAVRRNAAEQGVRYERAVLMKAVLCSKDGVTEGECERMEQLDTGNRDPAYLCGRLLAELEAIQRVAINPKATLVDRYYGTASSAPAAVFGTLLRNAQPHLALLRKNRPGTHSALQRKLEEIMDGLGTWPRVLSLEKQALFALGYYHQRAEDRRAAIEAMAKKLSGTEAPLELADDAGTEE